MDSCNYRCGAVYGSIRKGEQHIQQIFKGQEHDGNDRGGRGKAPLKLTGHLRCDRPSRKGAAEDHYDPRTKTVNLSESVFHSTSVAAIGVAAHECGHAMQDNVGYVPLKLRGAIVPVANIGSQAAFPLIIIGVLIGGMGSPLVNIGLILFSLAVIFQLITLPVELNASRRAITLLDQVGILGGQEVNQTRKVLGAAALTYVAALAASVLQLLRLVILFGGRRDND